MCLVWGHGYGYTDWVRARVYCAGMGVGVCRPVAVPKAVSALPLAVIYINDVLLDLHVVVATPEISNRRSVT